MKITGLDNIEQSLNDLLDSVSLRDKRKVLREIGIYLKRSNKKRITAQKNIDGTQYKSRKKRRKSRNKRMLLGFRSLINLKQKGNSVDIGLMGWPSKVGRVHHEGKTEDGISYPSRELVGFNQSDIDHIEQIIQKHIGL